MNERKKDKKKTGLGRPKDIVMWFWIQRLDYLMRSTEDGKAWINSPFLKVFDFVKCGILS